ncbi:hypothetical protein [Microvirga lotononidis]|uniref:Uncharacterized protein n=1 Tax=Microvirga lotononidis TaxID=864069 RepID=I4YSF0_9HYPH|nr:hypothetical protein [Microvirga lotononidis]EIM26892.1 hypothetical protein MicloDRAFT_00034430 [Microvirga lotononidis]WQO31443.1 hypothetical protein U0023_34735 [Microvirga lotononidis]
MSDVPSPASLSAVQSRIDDIADQAGVEGAARLTVDDTLTALPWPFRRRLVLTLQSLKAFSSDPEVQRAAEFFQLKAARVWAAMPFQGHAAETASRTTVLVEHRSGRPTTQAKKL